MTSVALVVLDTLRKDAFDRHFDWIPGIRYDNAWSTSSWTVPVHASLFTGKYPSEAGVYAKTEGLDENDPVLAEALQHKGYTTHAFSCNPFISSHFQFDRGFDIFEGSWRLRRLDPDLLDWNFFITKTKDQGPARFLRAIYECLSSDVDTVKSLKYGVRMKLHDLGLKSLANVEDDGATSALKTVRESSFDENEFLFINLMEAHSPYDPPPDYNTVDIADNPGLSDIIDGTDIDPLPYENAYDEAVDYLSNIYKNIFKELSKSFDFIITLSDHGEMFGEEGMWGHVLGVYPELTHVPLVISDGHSKNEHRSEVVSLLDVHQTILDLAGVDNPSRGQNLLNENKSKTRYAEFRGLNKRQIHRLEMNGYSSDIIQKYDSPMFGIILPESYYGYYSLDGFKEEGTLSVDINPEKSISKFFDNISIRKPEADEIEEIPEKVSYQLKKLGYL